VESSGERRGAYRVLVEKPGEEEHLEDLGADGRIILKIDILGGLRLD
jgi:hypothetical protein